MIKIVLLFTSLTFFHVTSFSQKNAVFVDSIKFKGALVVNEITESVHLTMDSEKLLNSKRKRFIKRVLSESSIEIMEPSFVAKIIKDNSKDFPSKVVESKEYYDLIKFYRKVREDFSILYKRKGAVCYTYPNIECTIGILLVKDSSENDKVSLVPNYRMRYYIMNFR